MNNDEIIKKYENMLDIKSKKNFTPSFSRKNFPTISILFIVVIITMVLLVINSHVIAIEKDEKYQNRRISEVETTDDCEWLFTIGIIYAYDQNIFNENRLTPAITKRMNELGCK